MRERRTTITAHRGREGLQPPAPFRIDAPIAVRVTPLLRSDSGLTPLALARDPAVREAIEAAAGERARGTAGE